MKKLRMVIADDHALLRDGLRGLIELQADMEIAGEAEDGLDAVKLAVSLEPDVVVMDVSMPGLSGIDATRRIRSQCPEVRVLILTMHEDRTTLRQVLEAGASGYALKRAAGEELLAAIRTVAARDTYLHPSIAGKVVGGFVRRRTQSIDSVPATSNAKLTEREQEVVRLVALGHSNKEVGAQLEISVKTVETYRARVAEKLGLQSRVDLVRYAIQQGWMKE